MPSTKPSGAIVFIVLALLAMRPQAVSAQDKWFARDKAEHFAATMAIAAGGYAGSTLIAERERWRIWSGVGAGIGAAAAKEVWDRSHGGDPSWRDFAWGIVGTTAGVGVAWLVDRAVSRTPAARAGADSVRLVFTP